MSTTFQFNLIVDATTEAEAEDVVFNLINGRTFAKEVGAVSWRRNLDGRTTWIDHEAVER